MGGPPPPPPPQVADYVETLDLSQEDIQRTLSANMVHPSPSPSPADNSIINPMDFIDSSDDVLVNLDAFDMFSDLPELHDFEAAATAAEAEGSKTDSVRMGQETAEPGHGCHPGATVHIAEYSPEWSYTEGGVKVRTSFCFCSRRRDRGKGKEDLCVDGVLRGRYIQVVTRRFGQPWPCHRIG